MEKHYDFSKMKGRKNPYAKMLKQQITINIDKDAINYFKMQAASSGIPYQTLINMYLVDCSKSGRKLSTVWK